MKEPRWIVKEILKYRNSGSVLDLGSGVGPNSIFLAELGFEVTAVELKDNIFDRLKNNIEERGLDIKIIKSDITDFKPETTFDIVIATMVLHFLNKETIEPTIKMMQAATNPNGLNVVEVYTDLNLKNLRPYMFGVGELKEFYSNWKTLYYEENRLFKMKKEEIKDDGPEERYATLLIAEKQ